MPSSLLVENLAVDVRQVEIDHRLAVDAEVVLEDDLEDLARRNVARHKVAVLRIPLFEEVPALALRNGFRIALVAERLRNPDAAAFAARRLRHQPQLVFARNAGGMHLDKFAVRVIGALLIERRLRRSGTHNRVCGLAEDRAVAAGGNDDGIGRERTHFHRAQVHRADAAADAVSVEHGREELPVLVFLNFAFGLVAPDLLIERIKKLLPGRRAGKGCAVVQAFRRSGGSRASLRACG